MNKINLKNISHLIQANSLGHLFFFLKRLPVLFLTVFISFSATAVEILIDSEVEGGVRKFINPIFEAAGFDPQEIKVYIVLDNSVNAFVANGSNIFINTGLITLYNDPDVLKGVVAHELGHITGGHLARNSEKIQQLTIPTMATTLLGVAAAIGGSPEAGMALITGSSHTAARSYLSNSRSQESAADQAAIKFLHKSNNTAAGLVKAQEYFSKREANIVSQINPYSISHPLSRERLNIMNAALKKEGNKYKSTDEERKIYGRVVAKLRGFTEPIDSIFETNHKELDPFARKYELAIASYRKPDLTEALAKLDELIKKEKNNGYLYQLKGQFLFEHGKIFDSIESYKKSMQYLKNDYIVIAEYALALINAASLQEDPKVKEKTLKEAIPLLHMVTNSNIKNPYIYRNLAIAYGKLGDYGNSNLMLAEEAILYGKIPEAQNFVDKAKKHVQNDKKLQLRVDDTLKTLRNISNQK
jgi:predicted Zn-dependent protease